jgi:hypothetical protein
MPQLSARIRHRPLIEAHERKGGKRMITSSGRGQRKDDGQSFLYHSGALPERATNEAACCGSTFVIRICFVIRASSFDIRDDQSSQSPSSSRSGT